MKASFYHSQLNVVSSGQRLTFSLLSPGRFSKIIPLQRFVEYIAKRIPLIALKEEMQIDYAGDKLYIRDKSSGIWVEVVVLCCVMPYSSKAFAMGAFDSTQENLFHCLSRCMSYFGRVPKVAKSDNMVQWVKHGSQYERPFTESTDEWANHYDIIPDITRVRKPKDKAPVESLVVQVYKYLYARLRVYDTTGAICPEACIRVMRNIYLRDLLGREGAEIS